MHTSAPFRIITSLLLLLTAIVSSTRASERRLNVVLVMADDQGWGEVGYRGHPRLKTPNLDAMARSGIRFDRFYAGGPVCSPTRASVLTGRSHCRCGVPSHGHALRRQEPTIAQAMQAAGYATGHFGKWHLNGMRGPGVPILANDTHNPGVFGFTTWLSVTNFFDRNPLLSRNGAIEEYQGDSSEVVMDQALEFIQFASRRDQPSFTVVWFGTPHSPFFASEKDAAAFEDLPKESKNHYGELVAMDRSIGHLRSGLRELGIEKDTLVWFCSDNGGLPKIEPETVGGLRGFKGSMYEGGLRVPGIIEWPGGELPEQVSELPACVMDIFPTIAELTGLEGPDTTFPQDGISLVGPLKSYAKLRSKPIPFHYQNHTAIIDNNMKLIRFAGKGKAPQRYELYDLAKDAQESRNLYTDSGLSTLSAAQALEAFEASLAKSIAGEDYPEGQVRPGEPEPRFWTSIDVYREFFDAWQNRPEYSQRIQQAK